jgi:hypothetical protein
MIPPRLVLHVEQIRHSVWLFCFAVRALLLRQASGKKVEEKGEFILKIGRLNFNRINQGKNS